MRRRTFLASSVPVLAAVAGCESGTGSPGASADSGTYDPPSGTTTGRPSDADVQSGSDAAPAPDPASDVFADFGCPSFDDSAERTVCYHDVDPTAAAVVLGVDPEVFDPDLGDRSVETLTFTLYNRSAWHLHFNPDGWGIERFDEGEWVYVAPEGHNLPLSVMAPGGTCGWEIPSRLHPTPRGDDRTLLDVALSAGVYAFHVAGSFGTGLGETKTPTAEPPDERFECVGLFRLERDVDPASGPSRTTKTTTEPSAVTPT